MAAVTPISQLASSTSTHRRFYLLSLSNVCRIPRHKLFITRSLDQPGVDHKTALSYASEGSKPSMEEAAKFHLNVDGNVPEKPAPVKEDVPEGKRAAKIHDFCFGIPYGGLILSAGALGFVFSRDPSTLLFGGALLALSTMSLKIWRQGKSSLPFILGQAALAAVLFWKNFKDFSLAKKLFPTGSFAAVRSCGSRPFICSAFVQLFFALFIFLHLFLALCYVTLVGTQQRCNGVLLFICSDLWR